VSEENVELVRRWLAWLPDLRDFDPADDDAVVDRAFRGYLDESFELHLPADYPEGEHIFRGREGILQYSEWLRGVWAEWHFEPERFIDTGEYVVVFLRIVARSTSGVPVDVESTQVVTSRGDRIASIHAYRDRSQALKAVGLEE
jgi:ketosteroid isomerase-like protein